MDNIVSWKEYLKKFDDLLSAESLPSPYDNPAYFTYLKLNASRQNRWLKKGIINQTLKEKVDRIETPQTWNIITEPWCGDAAHSIPFLILAAQNNGLITIQMVWRDTPPFMIDAYLTKGGKSVPKLVVRDTNDKDLFTWGPRPKPCQEIYLSLKEKEADFEEMKITLQQWYNKDKGQTLQSELEALIESTIN